MKLFFIVLARNRKHVMKKIEELSGLRVEFIVVCGEYLNHERVVYRKPRGKFDAMNFGVQFVPSDVDIVAFNDVDTKIYNIEAALNEFSQKDVFLVFAKVSVKKGPQVEFYSLLDFIRRRIHIAASGELMFVRRNILQKLLPLIPCKSEDTYLLFKVLEHKLKAVFCEKCYVETKRTEDIRQEERYKRRTVAGIYQALANTNPPILVKLFYTGLPIVSPLLLLTGPKGYYWVKGIVSGFSDFLCGDRIGSWQPI